MKRLQRLTGIVSGSVGACALLAFVPASARATSVFSDTFDTGVSGASWEVVPGTNDQILVGDSAHVEGSPPYIGPQLPGGTGQSAKQVAADPFIYYMRTIAGSHPSTGTLTGSQQETLTTYLYDDGAGSSGGQMGAGVMLAAAGSLNDFYQLNINSVSGPGGFTDYNWRTSTDGTFDTGVARTQGWHKFQIVVNPYTGGSNDVQFYIDNGLVGSGKRKVNTGQGYVMDDIRLGISFKTPGSNFWYDNVDLSVNTVPEPATALLLAPMSLLILRRRRTIR